MQSRGIEFNVENFRAIKKANIIIDGITVVAGENGSGKSSVSKLIYKVYSTYYENEYLIRRQLYFNISKVIIAIELLKSDFPNFIKYFPIKFSKIQEVQNDNVDLLEHLSFWKNLLNEIQTTIDKGRELPRRVVEVITSIEGYELNKFSSEELYGFVSREYQSVIQYKEERKSEYFLEHLNYQFLGDLDDSFFELKELDSIITSTDKDNLSTPYFIQRPIYIDTPNSVNNDNYGNEYWLDLISLLKTDHRINDKFSELISKSIIKGNTSYNNEVENFLFKRKDGKTFNLNEVATGIKSFSIIQMLLNNGQLDDKTLLILDEPESNLHPQWIIEYARLIVLLNKEYGVKFFIASHNPDMISAIRYISEKEEVLETTHFYLSEKEDEEYQYTFKHLDKDIEPIFESFNIALDKISLYGA